MKKQSRTLERQMSFYLPPEKAHKFKIAVAIRGETIREVLERAIDQYIEEVEKNKTE